MRTHSPAAHGGIVTVFALVVGCSSTTAGFGAAQSTPPVTSAATVLEQTTVTQTQTLTQTTTLKTTTAQPSTPVPPRTSPVSASSSDTSDAEIRTKVAGAVDVVETYWVDLFNTWKDDDGNPVAWWPPELLHGDGFFDSTSGPAPRCGADSDTAGNAFFCGSVVAGTGYMAWDMQFFRDYAYLGDAMYYMVVAHETAHAAQVRFEHDGEGPAVLGEYELQADCIGGATLAKAEQDGYLIIEDGALGEMTRVSHAMGDYSGDIHGTPEERDSWFQRGYHGYIESCLGNR
jgi:predicted metalloprotease